MIALLLAALLVVPPAITVRRAPGFLLKSQIPATIPYYQRMPSSGEVCAAISTDVCALKGLYRRCSDPFTIKNNPRGIRSVVPGPTGLVPGPWVMEANVWCDALSPDNCPVALFPTFGSATIAAPTNLVATTVDCCSIKLTWIDTSTGEAGFMVERSFNGVSGWETVGYTGPGITTFYDCFLNPSTTYYYRIITLAS